MTSNENLSRMIDQIVPDTDNTALLIEIIKALKTRVEWLEQHSVLQIPHAGG